MNAVVSVTGKDQVGIIAAVCVRLAEHGVNVLEISQTVMRGYFTMMMVVDVAACADDFHGLCASMEDLGKDMGISVRIQREDIFNAMHRI